MKRLNVRTVNRIDISGTVPKYNKGKNENLEIFRVPMLYFLNVGTVPMLYFLNIGTVPMLYFLNVGTVPMLYFLNVGTVPTFSHSLLDLSKI